MPRPGSLSLARPYMRPTSRRLCDFHDPTRPPLTAGERLGNFVHRVAAGGLIALSLAGLGYIGLACVEVFGKHRRRKLEASAAAQPR